MSSRECPQCRQRTKNKIMCNRCQKRTERQINGMREVLTRGAEISPGQYDAATVFRNVNDMIAGLKDLSGAEDVE